ncbi:MAG: GlxA family transcriptional regulator [Chthoniobacterales bacterium]
MKPRVVGFVGFDGVVLLDLTGPLDTFVSARNNGARTYQPLIIGVSGRSFITSSGVTMEAQLSLKDEIDLDTLIIPGGTFRHNSAAGELIAQWLVRQHVRVRRIASVSTGIYPLAQSGLLDGRCVTTHWRYAHDVANTFRNLKVDECGSFIKDDRFYTCGGGTAGIEMSLTLIQEDHGPKTALDLARELVVNLRPSGKGERYVDPALDQPGAEERLAELPAWIASRLRTRLSLKILAERACLCPRHFSRVFKRTFQSTPADLVEHLRMTEAGRRLAAQPLSIGSVAESVGYKSALAFRRAFRRRFGTTPRGFQNTARKKLQPMRQALLPVHELPRGIKELASTQGARRLRPQKAPWPRHRSVRPSNVRRSH